MALTIEINLVSANYYGQTWPSTVANPFSSCYVYLDSNVVTLATEHGFLRTMYILFMLKQ